MNKMWLTILKQPIYQCLQMFWIKTFTNFNIHCAIKWICITTKLPCLRLLYLTPDSNTPPICLSLCLQIRFYRFWVLLAHENMWGYLCLAIAYWVVFSSLRYFVANNKKKKWTFCFQLSNNTCTKFSSPFIHSRWTSGLISQLDCCLQHYSRYGRRGTPGMKWLKIPLMRPKRKTIWQSYFRSFEMLSCMYQ